MSVTIGCHPCGNRTVKLVHRLENSHTRARKTGKLLQIGYQRRSSPRHRHVEEILLREADLIEDVTAASTQWNPSELETLGWPRRHLIPEADLECFGYANMHEFRNWRWFRRYRAGPFAIAAVHQIDVLNRPCTSILRTFCSPSVEVAN